MKKFLILLLAIILLGSAAMADGMDYASMTDEELHTIIANARNELARREYMADGKEPLFTFNGVTICLTGNRKFTGTSISANGVTTIVSLDVIVTNDSDVKINISVNDLIVNGWNVDARGLYDIPAHSKKKGLLQFYITDEFDDPSEITDLKATFFIVDAETYHREEAGTFTVHFNQQ